MRKLCFCYTAGQLSICAILAILFTMTGCGSGDSKESIDTDANTDTGSETSEGSDTGIGPDTSSETDTVTDTGTGADIGTDSDTGLDTGLDTESETEPDSDSETDLDTGVPIPPVYVTFAGHLEDVESYAQCATYPQHRENLLAFAELIKGSGIAFHLQVEYEFFHGATNCETKKMQAETGGTNVIDYLANHYGFRIDAHQEGGWEEGMDNYADVRFIGGKLTEKFTEVVGGFKWDDSDQFDLLAGGEPGRKFPEFTWYPEILTLGVGTSHHVGNFDDDDLSSGIWRPTGGGDDFFTHDPQGSLVYIAPGLQHQNWGGGECEFNDAVEYVTVLTEYLEKAKADRNKLYTCTVALPQQAILKTKDHETVLAFIEGFKPLVEAGKVVHATYEEIVDIWKKEYDEKPNIFRFDEIDPVDYTCE